MRWPGFLGAVLLAACGGGGSASPVFDQQVVFGFVRADADTRLRVEIANPLAANATAADAGGTGGFAAAAGALPAVVPAGGELSIEVVCTPGAPGPQSGQIRVRFVAGAEEREIVLRLDAVVESAVVSLLTGALAFPTTPIGQERSLDVRVRNPNQVTPVILTSVGVLPAEFTTDFQASALLPGDTIAIRVTYAPLSPNAFDFDLEIANNLDPPLRVRVKARADTWASELTTDFGDVPLVQGNQTAWLDVVLPAVAISLSIDAVSSLPSTVPGLAALEGPGGKIYVNAQATGPFLWSPGAEGVFAATLPQSDNPNVQLVPGGGTYRFRLYRVAGSGSSFHVRAIVENRDGVPANEGQLDLNVFFASALQVTGPETDSKVQAALARVDDILAQAGLHVGDVAYYQLSDPAYDVVNANEIPLLLEESSAAAETRANVFFVQSVAIGTGVFGVSAGIPGPKLNGSRASGIAVDYDMGDAAAVGFVAAHELGHYLGLRHTTESDGSLDLVLDTLPCPAVGTNAICTTEGGGYLMHWIPYGTVITNGQAHVLLAHPLVDPLTELTGLAALAQKRIPELAWVELPPGFCATCAKRK